VFFLAVQWSCDENFSVLAGEREVFDMKHLECHISDLTQGCRYYFRVACGNLKGYGNYRLSSPASVIPSSKCSYYKNSSMFEILAFCSGVADDYSLLCEAVSLRESMKGPYH
jgi:hypothetical protein